MAKTTPIQNYLQMVLDFISDFRDEGLEDAVYEAMRHIDLDVSQKKLLKGLGKTKQDLADDVKAGM